MVELSCSFPPGPRSVEYAELAETLGYQRIWLYDSPVLYRDVWVTLATIAEATRGIGLGVGVLVPSLRHVTVTASAILTLDALAPGRLSVAAGTGFTGRRLLGQPPLSWRRMEGWLRELRALLRGERVEIDERPVELLHPKGHVAALPSEVPILVAANGPRGLSVARAMGDGLMTLADPPGGFPWCAVARAGTVLDLGESLESPRVFDALAPALALIYHSTYESGGAAVDALPGGRAWRESIEAIEPELRHLTIHEGHCVEVPARERPFIDPGLGSLTFTGTPEALRERIGELEGAGATELVYSPGGPDIPRELRAMAEVVSAAR